MSNKTLILHFRTSQQSVPLETITKSISQKASDCSFCFPFFRSTLRPRALVAVGALLFQRVQKSIGASEVEHPSFILLGFLDLIVPEKIARFHVARLESSVEDANEHDIAGHRR
jgi:hypothetical protein